MSPFIKKRLLLRLAFVIAFVIQCWALYSPTTSSTPSFPHSDKVAHFILFAVVTALAVLSLIRPTIVIAAMATQAVISESVQAAIPSLGRSGDLYDIAADLIGIVVGLLIAVTAVRRAQVAH